MKKILTILCFVISVSNSFGQIKHKDYNKYNTPFIPETFIGVKGGATFSKVAFQNLQDPNYSFRPTIDYLQGINTGLVVRHVSERLFGIQAELNYTQKGWQEEARDDIEYSRTLNYFEIPIMTHVNVGKRRFRFIMNLGPSISFLIDEKESLTAPSDVDKETQFLSYYEKSIDSSWDFQFVAGGGFEYHTGIGTIGAEGRYALSLINIFDEDVYTYNNSLNQSISVSMYWLFQTNKKSRRNIMAPKKK